VGALFGGITPYALSGTGAGEGTEEALRQSLVAQALEQAKHLYFYIGNWY
jgi:hypothetical protein